MVLFEKTDLNELQIFQDISWIFGILFIKPLQLHREMTTAKIGFCANFSKYLRSWSTTLKLRKGTLQREFYCRTKGSRTTVPQSYTKVLNRMFDFQLT